MNTKFKIGDRVRYVGEELKPSGPKRGDMGFVVQEGVLQSGYKGVCFDGPIPSGHACDSKAVAGHGWYCKEYEIELIEAAKREPNPPLTIHTALSGGYYVSQGDEILYAALDTCDISLFIEEFLDDN